MNEPDYVAAILALRAELERVQRFIKGTDLEHVLIDPVYNWTLGDSIEATLISYRL